MNLPSDFAEVLRFAAQGCDDELTPDDVVQLEQLLDGNDEVQRRYLQFLELDVELSWIGSTAVVGDDPNLLLARSLATSNSPQASPVVLVRRITGSMSRVSIAATLLLVGYFVAIVALLAWDRIHRANDHQRVMAQQSAAAPAVLTQAEDASWKTPAETEEVTEATPQILQVRTGLAELRFAQGASVTIEGPAEFEVRSPTEGFLQRGKLTASVSPQAIGFTIKTPTAMIVDLGTEFGVVVSESGTTEVQVSRGKVRLQPGYEALAEAKLAPITLLAGEARRVEPEGSGNALVVRKISPSAERMVRRTNADGIRRIPVGGALASSTAFLNRDVRFLINGAGLSGNRHGNRTDDTMWHTAFGKYENEFVLFDLARPYRLDSMKVWNYNEFMHDLYRRVGAKHADIYVSKSGKWDPLKSPEEWTLVIKNQQFTCAPGTEDYSTPDVVPLNQVEARFVAIVFLDRLEQLPRSGHEHDIVGLSEVQFFGEKVELPSTPIRKNPQ